MFRLSVPGGLPQAVLSLYVVSSLVASFVEFPGVARAQDFP
jgi:hypothetical protein